MPRLIDDIRAQRRFQMPHFIRRDKEQAWAEYAIRLAEMFEWPELPVLLIDNVAEYYYQGTDQEYWDLSKDFPNLAPPFPQFWVEHKLPRAINSKEGNTDLSQWITRGRAGALITSIDPAQAKIEGELTAGTRWILWCDLWVDYGFADGRVQGPHGAMFLCVDAEGRILNVPWMQSFASLEYENVMKSIMAWLYPAFLAVSFLHCKNVTLEDHAVDKPLAKKWAAKHGGLQPTGYKTLVIEPLKQILKHQGRAHEHGLAKAMHICRGHFRDYREGRGLFGRLHGQFWIPATVRGTKGKSAPAREIEVKV